MIFGSDQLAHLPVYSPALLWEAGSAFEATAEWKEAEDCWQRNLPHFAAYDCKASEGIPDC